MASGRKSVTMKELEKYCVDQGIERAAESERSESLERKNYLAGQANAFMLVAARIRSEDGKEEGQEGDEDEEDEVLRTFAGRLGKALFDYWPGTYEDFASMCGLTTQQIDGYLFGGVMPDNQTIEDMAKKMGAPSGFLFGGKK